MASSKLYVDAFNFLESFNLACENRDLNVSQGLVKKFIDAAKNSNYEIKVFLDSGLGSKEANGKWRRRREAEVRKEYRNIGQGTVIYLGDMFRKYGIPVYYSPMGYDNDTCIASYAQRDHADILSNDADFFRYHDSSHRRHNYMVYGKFSITDDNTLLLKRKYFNRNNRKQSLYFIDPPVMLLKHPGFVDVLGNKKYSRGVCTSLNKALGNPHKNLTILRQVIYSKLGVDSEITEIWPEWDEKINDVIWFKQEVKKSEEHESLLKENQDNIFNTIFEDKIKRPNNIPDWKWNNHLMDLRASLYEIFIMYNDLTNGKEYNMLDMLIEYDLSNKFDKL